MRARHSCVYVCVCVGEQCTGGKRAMEMRQRCEVSDIRKTGTGQSWCIYWKLHVTDKWTIQEHVIFLCWLQNARLENVHIESDKSREKLHCKIQKLKSKTKNRKSTSNFLPGHAQHNKMHAYLNIRGKQLLNINTEFFL